MWNRWLQIKTENTNNFSNNGYGPAEGNARGKRRRPYLASECNDLNDADKFRQDILREIGRKVGEIQNVALSEPQLRELNDGINKLIRCDTRPRAMLYSLPPSLFLHPRARRQHILSTMIPCYETWVRSANLTATDAIPRFECGTQGEGALGKADRAAGRPGLQ